MLNLQKAEKNFWDNVSYNSSLAKSRAKPRHRGMVRIMRPEVVLRMLSEFGIDITERTLQKYVKNELIPMPERRSAGRGKGRITDYADETPAEFFASYRLMHGPKRCTTEQVSADRKGIKQDIKAPCGERFLRALEHVTAIEWLSEQDKILRVCTDDEFLFLTDKGGIKARSEGPFLKKRPKRADTEEMFEIGNAGLMFRPKDKENSLRFLFIERWRRPAFLITI